MVNLIETAKQQLRDALLSALGEAIAAGELPNEPIPAFTLEIPADPSHGDFASNLAMASARAFHNAPRRIAETVEKHLVLDGTYFCRAEIAGPGFMNFFLRPDWFGDTVRAVLTEKEEYGRTDFGKKEKVMVEFVSANPTGPMHMGNARGGALGDTLASILDAAGYDVTREFYINDAGNQINKFGRSLEARYMQHFVGEDAFPFPEDGYHGDDIRVHAENFIKLYGDRYMTASDEDRQAALVDYALPLNIEKLKKDLASYRIFYDVWFKESTLHESGAVMAAVNKLIETGRAYEKDGAVWYRAPEGEAKKKTIETEDGHRIETEETLDEVLVRQNGFPTYFAADIAYHYNKFAVRGFDRVINVWGADHHGHVARLKGAMDAIGLDGSKLDIVLMQLVRLTRDGEAVRMSKRSGKAISLTDLIEEVPVDAARFFFNLREPNSHLDFDLGLAVEKSSDNPVYYVQYAHARICSILKKLAEENITPKDAKDIDFSVLTLPEEKELIRRLASLPQEIIDSANAYDPARITRYAMDLAGLFHKFYNACRVVTEDEAVMYARISLCLAVKTVLCNVFEMLKITAPESM